MSYVAKVIDAFGGTREMSRKTNIRPSTIQSWKERGFIPAQRIPHLLSLTKELKVDLGPTDFLPPAEAA